VLILALDTSSRTGSVAVLQDEAILGVVATCSDENFSSRIFRQIEFLLRELTISLEGVDLFAVSAGPGSFTGLRVGLTAAKGWAEVYEKPIAAVGTLEAIAAQSRSRAVHVAAVLDARRGQVYGGLYRRSLEVGIADVTPNGEEYVMAPAEFLEHVLARTGNSEVAIVTPTPEVISGALEQMGERGKQFVVEPVSTVLAPVVGQLGYRHAQRGQLTDSLTLAANYIRRSDAELNWKNP
jgi:tRNA threonylcarbamoyladenosine biosynthesis protein TsaB